MRLFVLLLVLSNANTWAAREVFAVLTSNWMDNAAFLGATPYFDQCHSNPTPTSHEGNITLTISNPNPPVVSLAAQPRQRISVFLYKFDGGAANPAYWPALASVSPFCTVPGSPTQSNPPYCDLEPGQSAMFQTGQIPDESTQIRTMKLRASTIDAGGNIIADNGVLVAAGTWWMGINNRCKTGMDVSPIIVAGGKPF